MKRFAMAVATVVVGSMMGGCAMEDAENEPTSAESANTGGIAEGTREAAIVVKAANETSLQALIDEAGLSKLAALAIDAYRKGDDGIEGTEDDERFESLAELDAIPHVGPNEHHALLAFARREPAAVISGRVLMPNDAPVQPPVSIYAFKTDGSKYYKFEGKLNRPYALAVDPGEYYVVAYRGPFWTAGYTNAEHFLTPVAVSAGEDAHADPNDLSARRVPVEPTSPLTFGCGETSYAGICGTTSSLDTGPGAPQDVLTWCEGNILRRKVCDYSQKCAWESDSVGFNCVAR